MFTNYIKSYLCSYRTNNIRSNLAFNLRNLTHSYYSTLNILISFDDHHIIIQYLNKLLFAGSKLSLIN